MKKLLLLILVCTAFARSEGIDSLCLFDKETYQIGNIKRLCNWAARLGYQGGKMYVGKWLILKPSDEMTRGETFCYRGGGGVLFLHGLLGLIRECGHESPRKLFRYLEGRSS